MAFDVQDKRHPVRKLIQKNVGAMNFTATIEEDGQTLALFKHIHGLVAFVCTLKRDNEILAQGRGAAVLNRVNRYVERTVYTAANASLIDAVVRATKVLDTLRLDTGSTIADNAVAETYKPVDGGGNITEKQKNYLLELIDANVTDEDERNQWEGRVGGLSREEASEAIQSFKK